MPPGPDVLLPGTPAYEAARLPQVARFAAVRPRAIVRCRSAADVRFGLALARREGAGLAVRAGGHCFAGRSCTPGVLIDVGPMRDVRYADGLAYAGAGARLGDVYDALARHGVTVPGGCGETVGLAGLALGGGLGILGRRHGLTSDRLVAAEVVLADGRVLEAPEDLLWGLRGAGGARFGVVTRLTLETVPAPWVTTFDLVWPLACAADAIAAWQAWAPEAPDDVAASLVLAEDGVHLFGAAERAPLRALGVGTDPVRSRIAHLPYREAKRALAGAGPADAEAIGLSRSEFFRRTLPEEGIAALVAHFAAGPPGRVLDFSPWGGAYNRVAADATAFVHRAERFVLKHDAPDGPGASAWLTRSWEIAHQWGAVGVYPNFPDPALRDPQAWYLGANRARVAELEARYDPDGVFAGDPAAQRRCDRR